MERVVKLNIELLRISSTTHEYFPKQYGRVPEGHIVSNTLQRSCQLTCLGCSCEAEKCVSNFSSHFFAEKSEGLVPDISR